MSGIGDMERMVKLTGEKMRYRRIPEWCKDEALPTLIKYFDQVTTYKSIQQSKWKSQKRMFLPTVILFRSTILKTTEKGGFF